MGNVVMHNVVSVDGFIADENDQVGPLVDWYANGEYGLAGDRQDATGQLPEASYHSSRVGRHPASARGSHCGHPGRPRAAPALPGSPLTAEHYRGCSP